MTMVLGLSSMCVILLMTLHYADAAVVTLLAALTIQEGLTGMVTVTLNTGGLSLGVPVTVFVSTAAHVGATNPGT